MQIYKKILLSASICAVSLTACYYAALYTIPNHIDLNKYTKTIFRDIETQTGFKVSSEDIYFKKSLSPFLKIHLFHTAILYPDNSVFLQVKEADLQVKILPLLFKNLVIKDAELTRPIVNITLYKDYSTSLEKYASNAQLINTKGFKLNSIINDSKGKKYKIKFKDETINKTFYLEGDELILKDLKLNEKAHILMNGAIYEKKKEYIKYDLDIITALCGNENRFSFSPFKTIYESDVKGNIFGHLKIDKDKNINGNLKIEDLSLKLKDIVSSNNNANIVFKGKEAQIESVLHTSKNDYTQLTGKYSFGNKKYIDFNAKATDVNLENLIKIVSSLSKVLNIKNPLNDISAKGLLNADFNINSDFKKLKSKGKAEIKNGTISHKELTYPISDINANIDFNNNNIVIEQAEAKINDTPVTIKGKISEDLTADLKVFAANLYIKDIYNTFLSSYKLPFEIKGGTLRFESEIKGNIGKAINTISKIELFNTKLFDQKYKTAINSETIKIDLETIADKYKGSAEILPVSIKNDKNDIVVNSAKLSFDDKDINIENMQLTAFKSPVSFNGNIKNYLNNPIANLDFKGKLKASELAKYLKQYTDFPYKAAGEIPAEGKIHITKEKQNIKAKISADENNYISYIVIKELLKKPSEADIDVDIAKNAIKINDIALLNKNEKQKITDITGEINIEKEPELNNIKISIPNYITAATNIFGGEEISFKTDLLLNKNINNPEIRGNAKINYYNIKKYFTSVKNADVSFSNENIRLIAPNIMVNDSQFNIIANILPSSTLDSINISNMQINSLNLDLNSLFPMLYSNREYFANSKINIKNGVATVNNVQVLDLKAKDFSCDFQTEKNVIKLSNIDANAYSGKIQGKTDYDLYSGMLNINIFGNGVDIKNSLYDLCKIKDNLSGKANFIANLSLLTGTYNTVMKTLNGNIKFNAKNGGMGTLGKFEYYLSAKNIFYHGFLNTTLNRIADALNHDKTEQYKEAKGNLIIQNSYLISDGIQTKGTKMSLYLRGKHNILTNQSNIDIYGRISDDIKTKIGSFWNVSLSELINGKNTKNDIVLASLPDTISSKIPPLYNNSINTNLFKVNILGDISAVNSINSFEWVADTRDENGIESNSTYENTENNEEINRDNQEKETVPETGNKDIKKSDIKEDILNTEKIEKEETSEKAEPPYTPDFSEIPLQ